MDLNTHPLWLLTGPSQAGKTTFCCRLAQHARTQGWDVAGLLSPAWMEDSQKIGILAKDLRSGEQRPLAYIRPHPLANLRLGKWYFDKQVLQWGSHVLENSSPCDLLIVDELGPLEFKTKNGLASAFTILEARQYRVCCAVIRPSLLAQACTRWPWARILPIEDARESHFL